MRKVISILLVLAVCLSMAVTCFANGDFVKSPGEDGTPCDHEHTKVVGKKDPTCTEPGYTGDIVCEDCGEVIEKGEYIPAGGHQFNEDGICEICGASDVPKTGDTSNVILWAILMVVSAAALVVIVSKRRKAA